MSKYAVRRYSYLSESNFQSEIRKRALMHELLLIADIFCVLLYLALIMSWRAPIVFKSKNKKAGFHLSILFLFGCLLIDIPCLSVSLFLLITVLRVRELKMLFGKRWQTLTTTLINAKDPGEPYMEFFYGLWSDSAHLLFVFLADIVAFVAAFVVFITLWRVPPLLKALQKFQKRKEEESANAAPSRTQVMVSDQGAVCRPDNGQNVDDLLRDGTNGCTRDHTGTVVVGDSVCLADGADVNDYIRTCADNDNMDRICVDIADRVTAASDATHEFGVVCGKSVSDVADDSKGNDTFIGTHGDGSVKIAGDEVCDGGEGVGNDSIVGSDVQCEKREDGMVLSSNECINRDSNTNDHVDHIETSCDENTDAGPASAISHVIHSAQINHVMDCDISLSKHKIYIRQLAWLIVDILSMPAALIVLSSIIRAPSLLSQYASVSFRFPFRLFLRASE